VEEHGKARLGKVVESEENHPAEDAALWQNCGKNQPALQTH